MRRSTARPFVANLLATTLVSLVVFACHDPATDEPEFARANVRRQLTIAGTGTSAAGLVTSDRGGLSCTVAANGAVSGKCSQNYKSDAIITLFFAPAAGAKLAAVTGNCEPSGETGLACDVVMRTDQTVAVNFDAQSSTFTLAVTGGSSGSGQVVSTHAGINCTITNGVAGATGCSSNYAASASVVLNAAASTGSLIKAWAGGGCETSGTGAGQANGSCTVVMSQARSILVSFERPADVAVNGQWAPPFTWPALAIHATLLPNGKVITWGRMDHIPVIWDPSTNSFGSAIRPVDLFCSGHALLPDGRLLVTGGHSGTDNQGIRSAETYNYTSNTWTALPDMRNGRWYPSVLSLANGEMLTVSGGDTAKALNMIPEVLQTNGTWRALTGAAAGIAYFPMMFAAPDGRVFVAGPDRSTGYLTTSGTGGWASGPSTIYTGSRDYGSAVMYDAGKILLVGGGAPTATAERLDLIAGGGWQGAGGMRVGRRQLNATLLADGSVLVTGGTNAGTFNAAPTDPNVLAAERWTPTTGFTQLARQTHYRLYHSTALLLPDARLLSVGSGQPAAAGLNDDFTAEIFSPPYLFAADGSPASRPVITAADTSVGSGQTLPVSTPNPAAVAKITFIRLGAVTHATNMNQRLNYLTFTRPDAGTLSVTYPAANLAPPGHYMLFLVDANGVPSVAKIVRIH